MHHRPIIDSGYLKSISFLNLILNDKYAEICNFLQLREPINGRNVPDVIARREGGDLNFESCLRT